jgi:type IV fimbrial biogenesis protein FimT
MICQDSQVTISRDDIARPDAVRPKCRTDAARPRARGFTLIELVVTIAVAAILVTVALPNLQTFIKNNRIKTSVGDLAVALNLARSEASKRAGRVTVCVRASDAACGGGNDWSTGWLVFNDANGDGSLDAGEEVLRVFGPLPDKVELTAGGFTANNAVTYSSSGEPAPRPVGTNKPPSGVAVPDGVFTFCDDRTGQTRGRNVLIGITGRVAVEPDPFVCS